MNIETCPFCNRVPMVGSDDDGAWVECSECYVSTGYCSDTEDAIETWNEEAVETRKNE